jgi:hypothetical protein
MRTPFSALVRRLSLFVGALAASSFAAAGDVPPWLVWNAPFGCWAGGNVIDQSTNWEWGGGTGPEYAPGNNAKHAGGVLGSDATGLGYADLDAMQMGIFAETRAFGTTAVGTAEFWDTLGFDSDLKIGTFAMIDFSIDGVITNTSRARVTSYLQIMQDGDWQMYRVPFGPGGGYTLNVPVLPGKSTQHFYVNMITFVDQGIATADFYHTLHTKITVPDGVTMTRASQAQPVPEPSSLAALATGGVALAARRRRRRS